MLYKIVQPECHLLVLLLRKDSECLSDLLNDTVGADPHLIMELSLRSVLNDPVWHSHHRDRHLIRQSDHIFSNCRSKSAESGTILKGDQMIIGKHRLVDKLSVQRLGVPHVVVADADPLLFEPVGGFCHIVSDRAKTQNSHLAASP